MTEQGSMMGNQQTHGRRRTSSALASGAVGLAAVLVLAACGSGDSGNTNDNASSSGGDQKDTPAAFNAQPALEPPKAIDKPMIVPPAPQLPPLAPPGPALVPGAAGPGTGDIAAGGPNLSLTPNTGGGILGGAPGAGLPGGLPGVLGGTGKPAPGVPDGKVDNSFVAKITGPGSVSETDTKFGVAGTGAAVMWDNGNGQVLTAFGDTFGGPRRGGEKSNQPPVLTESGANIPVLPKELGFPALPFLNLSTGNTAGAGNAGDTGTQGPSGFDWRSNVLGVSSNHDLENGVKFDSFTADRDGHAGQILTSRKAVGSEVTTLPTSGVSVGGRQYISYSSVREWGPLGGSWTSNYSGLAYSDDNGATWKKDKGAVWRNQGADAGFQTPALVKGGDGFVYLYGTQNGRVGGVYVARVPEGQILDRGAYQYWVGDSFSLDHSRPPVPVITGGLGEVSVQYNPDLGRWMMLYTDVAYNGIVLRQGTSPVGPWSDPQVVLSAKDYPNIYRASIHPWSKGNDLFFSVSQWSSYNVYLMHASVTAAAPGAPRPQLPTPGGPIPLPDVPALRLPMLVPPPAGNAPTGPDE